MSRRSLSDHDRVGGAPSSNGAHSGLGGLLGVGVTATAGLSAYDVLDVRDHRRFREHLADLARGVVPDDELELSLRRGDGSVRTVSARVSPVADDFGQVRGWVHQLVARTGPAVAARDLARRERRLAAGFRTAQMGAWCARTRVTTAPVWDCSPPCVTTGRGSWRDPGRGAQQAGAAVAAGRGPAGAGPGGPVVPGASYVAGPCCARTRDRPDPRPRSPRSGSAASPQAWTTSCPSRSTWPCSRPPCSAGSRTRPDQGAADGDLVRRLIARFAERATLAQRELAEASESGAWDDVVRVAHSLRGGAANLGMSALALLCVKIELAAGDGEVPSALQLHQRDVELAAAQVALGRVPLSAS